MTKTYVLHLSFIHKASIYCGVQMKNFWSQMWTFLCRAQTNRWHYNAWQLRYRIIYPQSNKPSQNNKLHVKKREFCINRRQKCFNLLRCRSILFQIYFAILKYQREIVCNWICFSFEWYFFIHFNIFSFDMGIFMVIRKCFWSQKST